VDFFEISGKQFLFQQSGGGFEPGAGYLVGFTVSYPYNVFPAFSSSVK
jgi:hypothetical protein